LDESWKYGPSVDLLLESHPSDGAPPFVWRL
jgi:hypothetical protein